MESKNSRITRVTLFTLWGARGTLCTAIALHTLGARLTNDTLLSLKSLLTPNSGNPLKALTAAGARFTIRARFTLAALGALAALVALIALGALGTGGTIETREAIDASSTLWTGNPLIALLALLALVALGEVGFRVFIPGILPGGLPGGLPGAFPAKLGVGAGGQQAAGHGRAERGAPDDGRGREGGRQRRQNARGGQRIYADHADDEFAAAAGGMAPGGIIGQGPQTRRLLVMKGPRDIGQPEIQRRVAAPGLALGSEFDADHLRRSVRVLSMRVRHVNCREAVGPEAVGPEVVGPEVVGRGEPGMCGADIRGA